MIDKSTLRKKYKALRENLADESIEELSLKIANQALKLGIWDKTYYHLFLSITNKKEVDTTYLMHILQGKDKSIVVSKVDFLSNEMKHFLLQENTALKVSKYGIPEPVSGIEISPETVDVVFVPLLVFDHSGNRIGYGKGFYDRFLQKCSSNAVFIGVSFFEPEVEIPHEPTDIPLHYCITPEKTFDFRHNQLFL